MHVLRRAPGLRRPRPSLARAAVLLLLAALSAPPVLAAPAPVRVSLLGDAQFRAKAERGLEALYDMEFGTADAEFAAIAARRPDHPVGPFLGALTTWWRIQRDPETTAWDARFFSAMEETIRRSEARLDRDRRDLDGKFFMGAALAFRGRLRSMRGDWLPAAYDCRRALKVMREVVEGDPDNVDLYFGLGLYDYFGDVLPDRHPILRPVALLLPGADKERGLRQLSRVAVDGHFVSTEAAWYLLQIEFGFEKDGAESLRWADFLRRRHPGNALFHEMHGRVLLQNGRAADARAEFEEILALWSGGDGAYTAAQAERAYYSLGVSALRTGEYELALDQLRRLNALAVRRGEAVPLRTLGLLRRGMALDALGERGAAVSHYRQVLALPDSSHAHERARALLESPWRPDARVDDADEQAVLMPIDPATAAPVVAITARP
jgi:tetratricopeptide (TPR) repeat protein